MVKRLAALSHEQLLALLTELLDGVPDLSDWLETATRADGQVERVMIERQARPSFFNSTRKFR